MTPEALEELPLTCVVCFTPESVQTQVSIWSLGHKSQWSNDLLTFCPHSWCLLDIQVCVWQQMSKRIMTMTPLTAAIMDVMCEASLVIWGSDKRRAGWPSSPRFFGPYHGSTDKSLNIPIKRGRWERPLDVPPAVWAVQSCTTWGSSLVTATAIHQKSNCDDTLQGAVVQGGTSHLGRWAIVKAVETVESILLSFCGTSG